MEQQLITKDFELTRRLSRLIKGIAWKTQLNESWVFAALLESGLKRADSRQKGSQCVAWIVSGREDTSSLVLYAACISKELNEKIKLVAYGNDLVTYDGIWDTDEAAARLLVLALTDRECEFKEHLDVEHVDRLYMSNPDLGIKPPR